MSADPETLAHEALRWLLHLAEPDGDGLRWPWIPGEESDPGLYSGGAGVVLALLEAHAHFGDDRYADAALRGAHTLADPLSTVDPHAADPSLYFGLTGIAVTLAAVQDRLGAEHAGAIGHATDAVLQAFDGERWGEFTELLKGNAGIALGLLRLGDLAAAERAVEPYLRWAEPTAAGVHWESRAGMPGRSHHVAHGTLGIVIALAALGTEARRADLTDLASAGAADVVSRNEHGRDDAPGFLVPHSDPPYKPELNPRYSYGWCNGPAGDAQAFRHLAAYTGETHWRELVDGCWRTVLRSGLPARHSPGFWDNSGRCCGTAGVLALACDRVAETDLAGTDLAGTDRAEAAAFADRLAADLATRATIDRDGARWANHDHRAGTDLPPRTGWAMGNAGIVRELLRHARQRAGGDQRYAVPLPDHLPAPVSAPGER